jgi:hypothetical protein
VEVEKLNRVSGLAHARRASTESSLNLSGAIQDASLQPKVPRALAGFLSKRRVAYTSESPCHSGKTHSTMEPLYIYLRRLLQQYDGGVRDAAVTPMNSKHMKA